MINIKANSNGEETEVKCEVHIEGRKNAIHEFHAVIKALAKCDNDVFTDALGILVSDKPDEMLGGNDNDESES